MSANFRNPNFLLPNELNRKLPASGAETGSGLTEDRQSLYSMDFDGTAYVSITDGISVGGVYPNAMQDYTISMWFNATSFSSVQCLVFDTSSNIKFISIDSATSIRVRDGVNQRSFTVPTMSVANWYNIIVVVDNGSCKVYLNSTPSTTGAQTVDRGWTINGINGYSNVHGGSFNFTGKIDEVAIFNSALTLSEVQALSTASAPANIMALNKKPIAYYPLGEQARDNTNWQFPNEVLQSQVFDFDGTDKIEAVLPFLNNANELTFSGWFNKSSGDVVGFESFVSSTDRAILYWWSDNNVYWSVRNGSTSSTASFALTNYTWNHIAGTFNGSTNTIKLYINGDLVDTQTGQPSSTSVNLSNNFHIGLSNGTTYNNGQISNVAIWNSDQSTNINNIYNYGSPQSSYTVTPTAWYKLNATNTYAGLNPNWHSALDFVAADNDYIDLGTNSSLDVFGGDFSVSLWFKHSNASGNALAMLEIAGFSDKMAMTLGFTSNTGVGFAIGSVWATNAGTGFNDGEWHHMVATRTGTTYKIYVDNVDTTITVTSPTGWAYNASAPLNRIGTGYTAATKDFNGELSNIAIYNQVISAEDVKYLYNGGTPQTNISFEPVSWWKLDNLTTGIQDSGSASNNGTNSGATEVTDSVAVNQWNFNNVSQSQTPNWSSALDFNGSSNYINCGNDSSLSFSTSFSLSVWINNWTNDGNCVAMKGDGMTYGYFLFAPHPADLNKFKVWIKTSNNWYSATNDIGFSDNTKWVNLVVCYNSINNSLVLYSNGVPGSVTTTAGTLLTGAQDFKLGVENNTTSFYNGSISNASVWNTALTSAQVQTLYNNGSPEASISHSPISWWKLNNTASGIQDSGSASNDGTNNGAIEVQTNVWTPRLNGESDTLPSTALVSSDLQFESPYSNFSLDFDGAGNYINTSLDTDSYSSFSVSAWVNGDDVNTYRTVAAQTRYGNWANSSWLLYIEGGKMVFYIFSGGSIIQAGKDTAISSGVWYNIVGTWDGSKSRLYINAVKENTEGTVSSMNTSIIPTLIGAYHDSAGTSIAGNWNGKLDECAIFNKALNQAEISQVYNNGYAADLTSLSPVSWWRLGEDAYFVGNDITIPNQISGAPNGTGAGTQTSILVANAPGSYASGVGTNLDVVDRKGEAPESSANSQSINMIPGDIHPYAPGYVPAQVNNIASMNFNGLDENFQVSSGTSFDFGSNPFSFSSWIKRASIGDSNDVVIHLQKSGSTPTVQVRQNVRNIKVDFNIGGSWYFLETSTNKIGNDTNWHHLAVTKSGTSMLVYIDGVVQAASNNGIPATLDAGNGITLIGARGGNTQNWDGDIDEVAVFDYALSPKQIKEDIYNASTTGKAADLNNNSNLTAPVAWYRMGD